MSNANRRHPITGDTIFAKILRNEIPAKKVLETEDAVAFLDIHPVNFGHILLVPKGSYATVMDLPDDLAAATSALLPRLCRAVTAATGAQGINIIVNNGRVAGQTIDHVHWHIIPRFAHDTVNWPWPQHEYSGDEITQMQFRIQRELDLMG